tara:strand:+ start:6836 stop:8008 length:1173 start_codon:yes stop_codon:yes gene_type:complete
MSDTNTTELEKSIEELEAEVMSELEEVKKDNDKNKVVDLRDENPGGEATKNAKEVKGDPAQKTGGSPDKPEKLKAGDDTEHDGEELTEAPKTKADHLAMFEKMKASEIRDMFSAYSTKLSEDDEEEEEEEVKKDDKEAKEQLERRIKDINVKEDVDALVSDEDNLSGDFKKKAATIFEAAVKSKVRSEVERMETENKASLDQVIESKTEEIVEKVDNYLNYVVEEWTKENELAIERGLKGEIAEDFISGLKQLFQDHYIDVPNEKYNILEAQSEKITELENKLNGMIEKSVEMKKLNNQLVGEQVISEVSDDLADTEIAKFKELVKDVDFSDEASFRDKLNTLKESYFPKVSVSSNGETSSGDETTNDVANVETSGSMKNYMNAISRYKV